MSLCQALKLNSRVVLRAASGVSKSAGSEVVKEPNTFAFRQFKRLKEQQRRHFQTPGKIWYRTAGQKTTVLVMTIALGAMTIATFQNILIAVKK